VSASQGECKERCDREVQPDKPECKIKELTKVRFFDIASGPPRPPVDPQGVRLPEAGKGIGKSPNHSEVKVSMFVVEVRKDKKVEQSDREDDAWCNEFLEKELPLGMPVVMTFNSVLHVVVVVPVQEEGMVEREDGNWDAN